MDYEKLRNEILIGPLAAECINGSDKTIADILNRADTLAPSSRYVTARTILADLGATLGSAILDKLEAVSPSISQVKWMLRFLQSEGGVDVGHPETQTSIDSLVAGGVLTAEEGTALKGMGLKECSRAEIEGFGYVSPGDVSIAMRGSY